jgi:hypothetical protein
MENLLLTEKKKLEKCIELETYIQYKLFKFKNNNIIS